MKLRLIKFFILFLALLQFSSIVAMDDHHTDGVFGNPNAKHTLKSHDCGAKEIHKNIKHYCLACVRHANFNLVVISHTPPCLGNSLHPYTLSHYTLLRFTDYYVSASKRGPPPLFS